LYQPELPDKGKRAENNYEGFEWVLPPNEIGNNPKAKPYPFINGYGVFVFEWITRLNISVLLKNSESSFSQKFDGEDLFKHSMNIQKVLQLVFKKKSERISSQ